ncbi:Radical SAM superfamily protein [Gimesia alba]|uniref:Radical SAM superfamily protein n=1 Tax=Gimesia alba TaxID=2527973 RepID=A0A517RFN0_9PLAN|nr:RiPP maturation radical SAM C-methyltransferase [Gimesia alba]QDT42686.1 Radical SAM superfamily protein [Gimesia alba]
MITESGGIARTDAALVSMPFGPLFSPSIALGLLAAIGRNSGYRISVHHLGFQFAERIGETLYNKIASGFPATQDLAGEWLFSGLVNDQSDEDNYNYLHQVVLGHAREHSKDDLSDCSRLDHFVSELIVAKVRAERFIHDAAEKVLDDNPQIVGFTTVFQQNFASLALAKKLKELQPEIDIIFGGANVESPMGESLMEMYDCIDAVVSGEGEQAFLDILDRSRNGHDFLGIPGVSVCSKATGDSKTCSTDGVDARLPVLGNGRIQDMDSLPTPDFDDYFDTVGALSWKLSFEPRLAFETSRGCWWGEKHHCTFCGLNGSNMAFRQKSHTRAATELQELIEKYGERSVDAVDNILSMKYFDDFVPWLGDQAWNLSIFYETKANLTRKQLESLQRAKINNIQPGIESLSDLVLKLMKKGVSSIQNIQLLKWAIELGINVEWNIIWGFPFEDQLAYEEMAGLTPALEHLQPPGGGAKIRLDRYSPNFNEADSLGFQNIQPYPSYRFLHRCRSKWQSGAMNDNHVFNSAYFFHFDSDSASEITRYTKPLADGLKRWRDHHEHSIFVAMTKGKYLLLWDTRHVATRPLTVLHGLSKEIYEFCDSSKSFGSIQAKYASVFKAPMGETILAILEAFCEKRLMIQINGRYLSLAVPLSSHAPIGTALETFVELVRSVSQPTANNGSELSFDLSDYAFSVV